MRDLKACGLNAPKLRLSRWGARDVRRAARRVLLHEMMEVPTRADARHALEAFRGDWGGQVPKPPAAKLDRDWAALTTHFDFPTKHWCHLRTTNPIESSSARSSYAPASRRPGGRRPQGRRSRNGLQAARRRERARRRFNGYELVTAVLDDVKLTDGFRVPPDSAPRRTSGRRLRVFTPVKHLTLALCF
jgi:hypothetical protein